MRILLFLLILSLISTHSYDYSSFDFESCYDSSGKALKCQPDFVNAAFGKEVIASSTCGAPPAKHCFWTSATKNAQNLGLSRATQNSYLTRRHRHQQTFQKENIFSCFLCNSTDRLQSYPSSFLTDVHNSNNPTCWTSSFVPTSSHNSTLLTLSLGRAFEITYISMQFCYTKPDSLALYKSIDYGKTWIPYQFYSSQCKSIYQRDPTEKLSRFNENTALCSERYNNKVNLNEKTFNNLKIDFSTLEGRPSALELESNEALQDWQTATDIRIIFNRLFPSIQPQRSSLLLTQLKHRRSSFQRRHSSGRKIYHQRRSSFLHFQPTMDSFNFYSLSDLAIGGRCKCNGHASSCYPQEEKGIMKCRCSHNTEGNECQRCKAFFVDRPWKRATVREANECIGKNFI